MKNYDRYTFNGIRISESADWVCQQFHLSPSRWLPRLPKPKGVYRKVIRSAVDPDTGESTRTEDYSDFWWSGWDFLLHLVDDEEHPLLYAVVGQFYEIAAGVYDWIDPAKFRPVTPEIRDKLKLRVVEMPERWARIGPVDPPPTE